MQNHVQSLNKKYALSYVKTQTLIDNPVDYKLLEYIFFLYIRNYRYDLEHPDFIELDVKQVLADTAMVERTYRRSLDRLEECGLISRDKKFKRRQTKNGQVIQFNAGYFLGLISLLNETEDIEQVEFIRKSMLENDIESLKSVGFRTVTKPLIPKTSPSNIDLLDESPLNFKSDLKSSDIDAQSDFKSLNYPQSDFKSSSNYAQSDFKSSYLDDRVTLSHPVIELSGLDDTNAVDVIFLGENLEKIQKIRVKKDDFWMTLSHSMDDTNAVSRVTQIPFLDDLKSLSIYIIREKKYLNKILMQNAVFEEENRELKKQINVLLKKNQNSSTGESEDSNEFFEVGFSSSNKKTLQDEVDEIVGKIRNSFNLIGEWVPCTEKEISEFDKAKLQDRTVQDVIRSVKDKFIDGSQVNAKIFFDYLKELTEESFSVELDEPEDGSFDNYSIDDFAVADLSDDTMTDAEREQAISVKSIYELKRFCMKEYKQLFPFFKWEGMNIQVYYHQCEEKTLIERQREFKELHERVSHQFSKEDIALDDYDKKFKVIDAFNDRFPENQTFPYSTMVEGLQDLMIDINLFSSMDIEYNSYNILDGFHGSIKVVYDHLEDTAYRLPQKTIGEEREALARERSKNTLESLKSAANSVKSDDIDYGDLLLGYRPPRVKISEEKIIPANPALLAAFKHLGFKNGHVLEEWELNQICDAVIKKYNQRGHGLSSFSNTVTCVTMIGNGHRYELRGLSEPIVEDPVEEEPRPYVRRQRARRGS